MSSVGDAWNVFMESLAQEPESEGYVNLDKAKEIAYIDENRWRFMELFETIPSETRELRVLDIGTTPFLFFVKQQYPHYDICAMDRTELMRVRCEGRGIHFWSADLDEQKVPFDDGRFDVIIFTEVMEHIFAPPSSILRELNRIMAEGGKLIISVPNLAALDRRIKLLLGRSPLDHPDNQMKSDWVHGHGHIREYVQGELEGLVRGCGFEVVRKRFMLGKAVKETSAGKRSLLGQMIVRLYNGVVGLYPPFREVIFLECIKKR